MDWKPSKYLRMLLICLMLQLPLGANAKGLEQASGGGQFDSSLWQTLSSSRNFEEPEDSLRRKQGQTDKARRVKSTPMRAAELWMIPAILIPAILMVVLLRRYRRGHTRSYRAKQTAYETSVSEDGFKQQTETALSSGDYRTAFRCRYLQLLWLLEQKKLIRYRKDKTNTDYLNELRGNALQVPMQELTLYFDSIWYGKMPLSSSEYTRLSLVLDQMERALSV